VRPPQYNQLKKQYKTKQGLVTEEKRRGGVGMGTGT